MVTLDYRNHRLLGRLLSQDVNARIRVQAAKVAGESPSEVYDAGGKVEREAEKMVRWVKIDAMHSRRM